VTFLGAANGVAAMPAAVHENLRVALVVADADHAVLADEGHEEVAGVGDLRVMAHEVPCTGKDLLELKLIDLLVGKDAPVYGALLDIDKAQHVAGEDSGHSSLPLAK
jgi:hypothetical protein